MLLDIDFLVSWLRFEMDLEKFWRWFWRLLALLGRSFGFIFECLYLEWVPKWLLEALGSIWEGSGEGFGTDLKVKIE